MDMNEILLRVETLLGQANELQIDPNDPTVSDLMSELNKAKVRIQLSIKGIAVNWPRNGQGTVTIFRIRGSAKTGNSPTVPFAPVAEVEPTVQVSTVTQPVSAPSVSSVPDNVTPPKPEPVKVAPIAQTAPQNKPPVNRAMHDFIPTKIVPDVISILLDDKPHNIWFAGPAGCGKTVTIEHIARELGRPLFRLNCNPAMGPESFVGEKRIDIDEKSMQNFIKFHSGLLVQAMECGLDADGNEVGEPGILYIDEAGAMPQHLSILMNRLLEVDSLRRTLCLDTDGGRVVHSHSKFRIVFAANVTGRGLNSLSQQGYTAQSNALDYSLLDRMTFTFTFGYNRDVEAKILERKIGADKPVREILKFRDAIRSHIKSGKLTTSLSTRRLIALADAYRIFRDVPKSVFYTIMEQLLPEEKAVYNEQLMAQFGKDAIKDFALDNVDYM